MLFAPVLFAWMGLGANLETLLEDLPNPREIAKRTREIATQHPNLALVETIGTTTSGHNLEALRLKAPGPESRPAILVVANIEGSRPFTSLLALSHAERLATAWTGGEASAQEFLARTTVYVLPQIDIDAAWGLFRSPIHESSGTGSGVDNDRDARWGEDPPGDVNGDGLITSLRMRDPEGQWMLDPSESRLMIPFDPKESDGNRYRVFAEGRDLDGDGSVAEDPPRDARVHRNFPAGWEEHSPSSGRFATEEPETLALADFVLNHPDIALVVAYDAIDNLVSPPKGIDDKTPPVKRVPASGLRSTDAEGLEEIAKTYREMTGSQVTSSIDDKGTFQRWAYEHRGLLCVSATLWEIPTDASESDNAEGANDEASQSPAKTLSDDAKRLRWIDKMGASDRFDPWEVFDHPDLGEVEIGGFVPFARHLPPPDEWASIIDRHFAFFLTLGDRLPRVEVDFCRSESLGAGLFKISLRLVNRAPLPFPTKIGESTRTIRPVRIRLQLPDTTNLVAGERHSLLPSLESHGGRATYTWLVEGAPPDQVRIHIETDNAGAATVQPQETTKTEKQP